MPRLSRFLFCIFLIISDLFFTAAFADKSLNVAILCYHNLNPTVPGSMNMTPSKFEAEMKWLKDNGYNFIPLKMVVEYLQGKRTSLPDKAVVLTADDGWQSQYTYMYPIIKKYNIPATFFIYPGTISEGKHAMTWDELKELQKTGLIDIQGHTFSHPNFKLERKVRTEAQYDKFVENELANSKKVLEDKLGVKITLLAWPFGIYNPYLEDQAAKAGYTMAFTIDARPANKKYQPMSQPRYMIIDAQSLQKFQSIVKQATHN